MWMILLLWIAIDLLILLGIMACTCNCFSCNYHRHIN
jgi:hypothetical protein